MNYFERLLRRVALDELVLTTPTTDDPFERVAEWELDPVRAPIARASPEGRGDGADRESEPHVSVAAIPIEPPVPLAPTDPPAISVAASPPAIELRETIVERDGVLAETPGREESTTLAAANTRKALTATELVAADSFMAAIARIEPPAAQPRLVRGEEGERAQLGLDPADGQDVIAQSLRPEVQSVLPLAPTEPVLEMPEHASPDVTIGRIEVNVERERVSAAPAPRTVVVLRGSAAGPPTGTRGPSSQRFGIGQI